MREIMCGWVVIGAFCLAAAGAHADDWRVTATQVNDDQSFTIVLQDGAVSAGAATQRVDLSQGGGGIVKFAVEGSDSGPATLLLDTANKVQMKAFAAMLRNCHNLNAAAPSASPSVAGMPQKPEVFGGVADSYDVSFQPNPASTSPATRYIIALQPLAGNPTANHGGFLKVIHPEALQYAFDHLSQFRQLRQDTLHFGGLGRTTLAQLDTIRDEIVPSLTDAHPMPFIHFIEWVIGIVLVLVILKAAASLFIRILFGLIERL